MFPNVHLTMSHHCLDRGMVPMESAFLVQQRAKPNCFVELAKIIGI